MMELKLPNSLDPSHEYAFRSGEYGTFYQYWYIDRAGNYWRYSNAPEGHKDWHPYRGTPILDPEQVFPHQNPEFFTPEGFKRNIAPPPEAKPLINESYDPSDLKNIFKEYYLSPEGDSLKFVYLDKDCKENIDLYIQSQIRICDAGLVKYRKFASEQFQSSHDKHKAAACILMLADQAYFNVDNLIAAKVGDLDFIDDTVLLLGRKFKVDAPLLDYLSSRVIGRSIDDFLFTQTTLNGEEPFGSNAIQAFFAYLKVSSTFLPYWHATHLYSKIVNKYAMLQVEAEDVEARAFLELSRVLNTTEDVRYLVDSQVVNTLTKLYTSNSMQKSFTIEKSDDFGVAQVWSDLVDRTGDELAFSTWLHSTPLHSDFEGDTVEQEADLIQQDHKDNMTPEEQIAEDAEDTGVDEPIEDSNV